MHCEKKKGLLEGNKFLMVSRFKRHSDLVFYEYCAQQESLPNHKPAEAPKDLILDIIVVLVVNDLVGSLVEGGSSEAWHPLRIALEIVP